MLNHVEFLRIIASFSDIFNAEEVKCSISQSKKKYDQNKQSKICIKKKLFHYFSDRFFDSYMLESSDCY